MRKFIASLLIVVMTLSLAVTVTPVSVLAADSSVTLTLDKNTANVGDIINATIKIRIDDIAQLIHTSVFFNSNVVRVCDLSGDYVPDGAKVASQFKDRYMTAGVTRGVAINNDLDNNGDPLYKDVNGDPEYWFGAPFISGGETPQYPYLMNSKGLYRLMFINEDSKKPIQEQELITIRFKAVGPGSANIRLVAKSGEDEYEQSKLNDPGYVLKDEVFENPADPVSTIKEFTTVSETTSLTVTGTSILPTPGGTTTGSGGGGGGGGGGNPTPTPTPPPADNDPTVAITLPPVGADGVIDYEVPAKLYDNSLSRASAETGNVMYFSCDLESGDISGVNKIIVKVPVTSAVGALRAMVLVTKVESPFPKPNDVAAFDNQDIRDLAPPGAEFVICTFTKDGVEITIDGKIAVPLYDFDAQQSSIFGPPSPTPAPGGFADLPATHWAYEYIMALVEKGILNGMSATEFAPDANVTREQFAKMLVEALELYDEAATCDFPDMPIDHWAYNYVASAVKAGLITGYVNGEFGTGRNITRQEMAVMVVRGVPNLPETVPPVDFVDVEDIGDWALDAVIKMQKAGIIGGFPDGTFLPQDNATRAQAARIIFGVLAVL